jgi:hypothetical protein
MSDELLRRNLRVVDSAMRPNPVFVEDLHARLASELEWAPVVGDRSVQRPRFRGRRGWVAFALPTNVKRAATIAAVIVVAVIGYNLIPAGSTGTGGPLPTASSAPTPTPTPTPAPTPSPTPSFDPLSGCFGDCRGPLPVTATFESREFDPALSYAVPSGWVNNIDAPRAYGLAAEGGYIGLMTGPFARVADPTCNTGGIPDASPTADLGTAGVGKTLAEVVATLSGDPRLLTTPAQTVTVGDRTGQMIDISIAPTWTGTCEWGGEVPAVDILSTTDDHSGPGFRLVGTERSRFIFLDVGESVVEINIGVTDGTDFETFAAEVMPIIESMQFTP